MPSTQLRNDILSKSESVVVKLGTQLLTDAQGALDLEYINSIAEQVATLHHERGMKVTLVSSGAVGVGMSVLGLDERPRDLGMLQAAAAAGQAGLVRAWNEAFQGFGLRAAQVLLTRDDFEDRNRYLNLRNCIHHLHELDTVPIVNENDVVSVKEIRFGDNDFLAAMLANALGVDALVLLTGVDGLKDEAGKTVDLIESKAEAFGHVTDEKSKLGSGGMRSKTEAASLVAEAGELAVIAGGRVPDLLPRLFKGEKLGSVYLPAERKLKRRDRWIGMTVRPVGRLLVDEGAVCALAKGGVSLLAKGVAGTHGEYIKGDVVAVIGPDGEEIARGLVNYDAEEVEKIRGHKSSEFEEILGYSSYDEVIHCDNLVLDHLTWEAGHE